MSKYAFWSGYEIPTKDLTDFILSIPGIAGKIPDLERLGTTENIATYLRWTRKLPSDTRRIIPPLRLRYPNDNVEEEPTHIFFPIRFTNYTGEEQLEEGHPDSRVIKEERQLDKDQLLALAGHLKANGANLDIDKLSFAYIKDLHPSKEWRLF